MAYEGMIAETIAINGNNSEPISAYVARPLGPGPFPGMVLIHHMPGWDEWYREATRKFAHHGYAAISHNLLRAAGSLASLAYGKARGATIRRDLIDVAARTARHGRGHITLHLPENWHREHEWMTLFHSICGPPAVAA